MNDPLEFMTNPERYKKELFGAYKRIFSETIKESFLIEMVNKVENDQRYTYIFFGTNSPDKLFSIDSNIGKRRFNFANICKMIVMCHYINTVSLNDSERGKLQNDATYKNKLTDEVIEMFRFEKLATFDYSECSLESFLPLIYYVSAVTNHCGNKYTEYLNKKELVKAPYNSDFNYRMIYKLIIKIKACISLADLRAVDELVVVFRTLIELFMTYAALWDADDAPINSFYEFDKASFNYNYAENIPTNIKIMANDLGASELHFVNYGWIKNLKEFKFISNKSKSFNMNGLAKILDKKYESSGQKIGSNLYKCYKACNPQTHGTILIMNYFQLELHIFQNIAVMLEFISGTMSEELFDFGFDFGNFNLISLLRKSLDKSKEVYEWLTDNEKALQKTNMDYTARAYCCIRMKN